MYFCLNFDTRKEHKANAMKFNKIKLVLFCTLSYSVDIFLGEVFLIECALALRWLIYDRELWISVKCINFALWNQ